MTATDVVDIVEVGPRDGYQGIKQFIPTFTKIALLKRLIAAGLKRIEIGSFVSAIALPQLADTPDRDSCFLPRRSWHRSASAGSEREIWSLGN